MKKPAFFLFIIALSVSANLSAQRATDIEGSRDYPLVSRFKGSVIEWYQHKNFDRYFILDLKDNKISNYEIDGEITRIQYSAGREHSVFEIRKSYEDALKTNGFKILVSLDEKNCGINLQEYLYNKEFNGLNALPGEAHKPDYDQNFSYLAAKKKLDGKEVYLVLFVTNRNYSLITFDAVEVQALEANLVTVRKLKEGIGLKGHLAIYDIYFDTGKSEIKPESSAALQEIAGYLNAQEGRKFLIVGHTDNTGNFEENLKLSLDRANAVIRELTANYGVDPGQLKPYGDGSTAPVASNSTEEGRAKNRRVEIVQQ
jgi:OOP family OmpA-OmpF porin